MVFNVDGFLLFGQKLPLPPALFLGRAETCVVVVEGHLHLLRFEVQNEEIWIPTFVRAVCLQPCDYRGLLGGGALLPEPLCRTQTIGELLVRLK